MDIEQKAERERAEPKRAKEKEDKTGKQCETDWSTIEVIEKQNDS